MTMANFLTSKIKKGFTLAEVLITLVVIGVIAALTIPTVVNKYKKQEVASKLKKFYSNMQQAINMYLYSESMSPEQMLFPQEAIGSYDKTIEFWDKTIGKYLVTVKKSSAAYNNYPKIHLADGSTFIMRTDSVNTIFVFYCTNSSCPVESFDGKTSFLFTIYKGKILTSYTTDLLSRATCLNDCRKNSVQRHHCSRLIQLDGWQIKDDYPW